MPVFKAELPQILGIPDIEIVNEKCIEDVGIRGKGYAIGIYTLTGKTSLAFKNKTSKILPVKNGWSKQDWSMANSDTSYREVYGVAFNYLGSKALNQQSKQIKQLLAKDGVFHSFYYQPDNDIPRKVYFFVYDTNDNKIYIIDSSV